MIYKGPPPQHGAAAGLFVFLSMRYQKMRVRKMRTRLNASYSITLDTTPEPTVRPPSRIAKRRPCSMAMGVNQGDFHVDVVAGHHHFNTLGPA